MVFITQGVETVNHGRTSLRNGQRVIVAAHRRQQADGRPSRRKRVLGIRLGVARQHGIIR